MMQEEHSGQVLYGVCPENTPLIDVDLDSRTILLSEQPAYKDFLSVEKDHLAETIFFKIPRYFDAVDLNHQVAVVEYTNAANESHIAPILFKDITSYPGYLVLGWVIQGAATKVPGNLKFALRFYSMAQDEDRNYYYAYNLRTQPANTRILYGLNQLNLTPEEERIYADGDYLVMLNNYQLLATDLTEKFTQLMASRFWFDVIGEGETTPSQPVNPSTPSGGNDNTENNEPAEPGDDGSSNNDDNPYVDPGDGGTFVNTGE